MDAKTYQLIAYDVFTGDEALNWPNVAPTRHFQKGDIINEGSAQWEVVGVRNTSKPGVWLIDVRRLLHAG